MAAQPPPLTAAQMGELTRHVLCLTSSDYAVRDAALLELSRKREDFADLAPLLWHSFGTITALLQVRQRHAPGPRNARRAAWRDGTRAQRSNRRRRRRSRRLAGDRGHLPLPLARRADGRRVQPRVQRAGAAAVRGEPPGDARALPR